MMHIPQINPCCHLKIVPDMGIFLIGPNNHTRLLRGAVYEQVLSLIDGKRSVDEIASRLSPTVALPHVYFALAELEKKDYILEASDGVPAPELIFWLANDVPFKTVLAHSDLTINVLAVSTLDSTIRDDAIRLFGEAGLAVGDSAALTVVLTDHYQNGELAAVNRAMLEASQPWMLIKPVGMEAYIGPVFLPYETACWDCLRHVLELRNPVETFIRNAQANGKPMYAPPGYTRESMHMALHLAALQIRRWLMAGSGLAGELISLDPVEMTLEHHPVNRRQFCSACGDTITVQQPEPLRLQSQLKRFTQDGGYRAITPQTFLRTHQHLTSRLTGICPLVPTSDPAAEELNVYASGQNISRMSSLLEVLRRSLRYTNGGKGASATQGQASAIGENLERYSGLWQGGEYVEMATYHELGDKAIRPNTYLLYSEAQQRTPSAENLYSFTYVPPLFDPAARIMWTPVWSLTHETFRYIVTSTCYYRAPDAKTTGLYADSNGCAAGAVLEEAILQGFFELVERDGVGIWWYNRVQRPGIDLDSFDAPFIGRMRDFYRSRQRELWALDLTNDLGIPTFAALSRRIDQAREEILMGFGSHFDPQIALLRAIGEVNQMFVGHAQNEIVLGGEKDDCWTQWFETVTVESDPYLAPLPGAPLTRRADYPYAGSDDLLDDVRRCQQVASEHGMEMLVLDQTRPDIGVAVARVIVPGLRHFWQRLAPGRLYDVPVKLGWLDAPLAEADLNPIPVFL